MSASLQELKSALQVVVNMIHPGWVPTVFSFMRSDPGGEEQEPHKDCQHSDLERAQSVHPGGVPGSRIFALQTATKIRMYTGCFDARDESKATVVNVPISFCVLFRGDIIHNDMPYRKTNYRIHYYLSYEGVEWTPDVVQNTLPEHSTCSTAAIRSRKGPPSTSTSSSVMTTPGERLTD
ncbi:hypothetical protein PC129_g8939 [Phytophthora cactorum]|uniref:Uncharacterized protein n=1 Tax=Phytophthora cactorum TaxID=29920 RepID=A0A329SYH6_9STRA|nr:hypothetical protein Pcac1_g6974 [Phytophthora cactorum]KAG2815048.1 hypothetical protein PC112_g14057 [Phytophthora cactorum]KAG2895982.1 hypothetical protein PC114_g15308 [Phytophthora cactorum]KAG2926817.1 hypothetical protein PC117_g14752 [Phytophthora cactorum]KAG3148259.1 hypothetical protein C6341_g17472 [Phytophthora cactorum]